MLKFFRKMQRKLPDEGSQSSKKEDFFRDIVCQVLANSKSKEIIDSVLKEFLPSYDKINLDYACKPDDKDYIFESEDEMISFFIDTSSISQVFYWNQVENNPDNLTVGADITSDNYLIISLTLDGTQATGLKYLKRLKQFLNSGIGMLTYVDPAEYEDGKEFQSMCKDWSPYNEM